MGEVSKTADSLTALVRTDPDVARARLAELFAVHGGCQAVAVAVGVSRKTLHTWLRSLEMQPPIRARKGPKVRRPSDDAIRSALETAGGSAARAASLLGISHQTVRMWSRRQPSG